MGKLSRLVVVCGSTLYKIVLFIPVFHYFPCLNRMGGVKNNWIHDVYPRWLHMKTAGLRIRVEPGLRDSFVKACRDNDQTAAQVLRAFMRRYVEKHQGSPQKNLFDYLNSIQSNTVDKE